ncbi:hypothetical protein SAMN05421766_10465 [Zobellia uliginosa]|uniref:Cytochrome C and Quinol oxidase polypeptide I n=1 Tax=Zobellia uliginosa TaxID=143224 RepID=A0ABY1KY38_9FLAO|nr:hypothetical protein [Zobellia uliginosa]SIS80854.1 hypothetical protein SAMN05421766_10465 [Zobellia uliginosa]
MAALMTTLRKQSKMALVYLVVAAALGCVLRFFRVFDIPVTYKFIVHAHSHIALLGWVYLALTTLLYELFLKGLRIDKKYARIFWFTQLTLVGMLLTFPFQGYAVFSIVFSTLFLFASYWFSFFFYKNVPRRYKTAPSLKCAKAAIVYLLVSSIGPWVLGAIMNILGPDSVWYRLAIYFYLHFLYNGWMIMALVAIFLFFLEKQHVVLPERKFNTFFWSLNLGIVFSFFLSTLFTHPGPGYYLLGGVGAVLQLGAFYVLLGFFRGGQNKVMKMLSPFRYRLLGAVALLWGIKMLLQLLSALPYFADLAVTYLDFTIGYLHWTFLGVVTMGLFLFLDYFKLLALNRKFFFLYALGFALTEALIFYRAIAYWQRLELPSWFDVVLGIASLTVLLALVGLLLGEEK